LRVRRGNRPPRRAAAPPAKQCGPPSNRRLRGAVAVRAAVATVTPCRQSPPTSAPSLGRRPCVGWGQRWRAWQTRACRPADGIVGGMVDAFRGLARLHRPAYVPQWWVRAQLHCQRPAPPSAHLCMTYCRSNPLKKTRSATNSLGRTLVGRRAKKERMSHRSPARSPPPPATHSPPPSAALVSRSDSAVQERVVRRPSPAAPSAGVTAAAAAAAAAAATAAAATTSAARGARARRRATGVSALAAATTSTASTGATPTSVFVSASAAYTVSAAARRGGARPGSVSHRKAWRA